MINNEQQQPLPELLAPVSSMESLNAALNGGCNAIYVGAGAFSARRHASLSPEEMAQVIDTCHTRQVNVYVTVNTLFKNAELPKVFALTDQLFALGADAFIVQDIGGAMAMKRRYGKEIRLHASTQMTANDLPTLRFLASQGIRRVVLGRELSLKDITAITTQAQAEGVETEVFVHGALCVCVSGQCLMSSMVGGRSGNRGVCAQPCRQSYSLCKGGHVLDKGYLLSPKDLMGISVLPQLVEAGVASLKIEGRMKSPEYVALATKTYRDQLEKIEAGRPFVSTRDVESLAQIFSRGGVLTEGYFTRHAGKAMMSTETPKSTGITAGIVTGYNHQTGRCTIEPSLDLLPGDGIEIWTNSGAHVGCGINRPVKALHKFTVEVSGDIIPGARVTRSYHKGQMDMLRPETTSLYRQATITCQVQAVAGEPLALTFSKGSVTISVTGDTVEPAKSQPLTAEALLAQLAKTGGTPFTLTFENCHIGDSIFISKSQLNALRREGLSRFEAAFAQHFRRTGPLPAPEKIWQQVPSVARNTAKALTVYIARPELLPAVLQPGVARVYVEAEKGFETLAPALAKQCQNLGIALYAALPLYESNPEVLAALDNTPLDGFLLRTLGQYHMLAESPKAKVFDYTLNVFNSLSVAFLQELKQVAGVSLSPELTLHELNDIGTGLSEILAYGRLPVMTTRQCPVGLYAAGKQKGKQCALAHHSQEDSSLYTLKDKKGMEFPVLTNCDHCVASILHSRPVFTLNKMQDMLASNTGFLRLAFTTETTAEAEALVHATLDVMAGRWTDQAQQLVDAYTAEGVTAGHYYRGVE